MLMQLVVTYRNIYSRLGKVDVIRVKRRKVRISSPRVSGMLVGAASVLPSSVCRSGNRGGAETRSVPGRRHFSANGGGHGFVSVRTGPQDATALATGRRAWGAFLLTVKGPPYGFPVLDTDGQGHTFLRKLRSQVLEMHSFRPMSTPLAARRKPDVLRVAGRVVYNPVTL